MAATSPPSGWCWATCPVACAQHAGEGDARHFLSWRPRELVVLADGPVSWGQALRAWAYVLSLPLALLAGGATGWHPWLQMLPVTLAAVAPWPWRWRCRRR